MPNKKIKKVKLGLKKLIDYVKNDHVIRSTFYILMVFSLLSWFGIIKIGPVKLSEEKHITMIGNYVSIEPNQVATFTATITEINKDKNVVVETLVKKSTNLTDEIKKFGIDQINIKTINNVLYQSDEPSPLSNTKNPNLTEKLWRGSVGIEIKLDDISKVAAFNALLSGFENTEVFGPNYNVDEQKIDEARLLSNALEDAKNKALFITKNNNLKLGKILNIEEIGNSNIFPYSDILGMGGGGEEFSPGSTKISKTIKVKFELK
ncbi:hypothetical protein A2V49_03910 [candidate division WWE3 bacterium RBG_19FT_COMBO_34_6]|uniref:DUF541 domain-containing protein n=1 Tax=candidate division WWE3 bacterium RBG_19FT_COMBO_34_6 TaxID=1802612 RepID=A0A1F4UKU6_UNCKA|nr:MAG: hypothetical protein A2V49_03910 [candidate division WWE3 bacterium RBG_19FT_COMBO_34_6]